jgi:electron transport complex protein RnfB
MADQQPDMSRRGFLANGVRGAGLASIGGVLGAVLMNRTSAKMVWQIDPWKCIWCERCATECVLNPSAVKCVNVFPLCGYCDLCTGYFEVQANALSTAAENQLCPTGALIRKWVEGDYYEYTVDAPKCIGCARCVKGCTDYGNGSLFLQIDQQLCVQCNRCSIAANCPSGAISRAPVDQAYRLKNKTRNG